MPIIAGSGDTAGHNILAGIDIAKLKAYLAACMSQHVHYGLGDKAQYGHLSEFPPTYTAIDCSGWVRCAIAYATNADPGGPFVIPDGSVNQHDFCDKVGLKRTDYVNAGLSDGHLRIAFLTPYDTSEGIGHVWIVLNGMTLESHGGSGPDSRKWNTPILLHSHNAYVLC